jgi:predicted heme/steroid binding protein/uncharacterized membrane protein
MRQFDVETLSEFNGKEGKPIYIAHEGKVYDVSASKLWQGGVHMKRHHAARNLSTDIQAAPHGTEVLERYPQVGILKQDTVAEREMPRVLAWLMARFPMLRRHPHPMTVHFPIVFMFSTTVFNILYLITGIKAFELTALHCLGAGIFFTPVVILTGYYTWWHNYMAKPVRSVQIKRPVAFTMFAIQIILFVWRIAVPDILSSFTAAAVIYFLLVLSLLPLVTILGWFGAMMTFPIERD